jgi:hypothetical protein
MLPELPAVLQEQRCRSLNILNVIIISIVLQSKIETLKEGFP